MVDLGLPGLGGSRELILRGGREMNPESGWGDCGGGGGAGLALPGLREGVSPGKRQALKPLISKLQRWRAPVAAATELS